MQNLYGTREDPFLREFKWMDIKDDPEMRDFVDKWVFYQHPGDPRPRRYHVEGNCTDDCKSNQLADLVSFINIISMGSGQQTKSSVEI
jgi:hypothetical protein